MNQKQHGLKLVNYKIIHSFDYIYIKVQNNAKLISGVRSQDSDYPGAGGKL